MFDYVWKKVLQSLCTVLGVTFITFFLVWLMPGDAVSLMVDMESANVSHDAAQELRTEYNLDRPFLEQYMEWLGNMVQGDFGISFTYHTSSMDVVSKRMVVTFRLGIVSFAISTLAGMFLGFVAAKHHGSPLDGAICFLSGLGVSTPPFLVAIFFILLFCVVLGWLPVQGYTAPSEDYWLHIKKMILPSLVASFGGMAPVIRQTRASVLGVLGKDFVRTAIAKGLKKRSITIRYVMRNAFIPILTLLGMQICVLFGGVVIVENVFNIPGMGSLIVSAVKNRDVPLIQMCMLVMAVTMVASTLLVDIAYGIVDPRMRKTGGDA